MGATYFSIQAHTTDRDAVLTCARSFAGKHPYVFQCYVGEALGQWTAVYPSFSAVMDPFAKELSQALGCLVLTLASADEDEVLCNFCLAGKDYSYFKVTPGRKRSPKQQAPVAKKLALLEGILTADQQKELLAYISHPPDVLFSSDVLKTLCQALAILNATTSYDYILRNDYSADLDRQVELVKIG